MKKILILCVSLKESLDRQEKITKQLITLKNSIQDIQIEFSFFDAVYGKKLQPEYLTFLNISRQIANQCEHDLGPSELGCFLSHMILWQRLSQGDYKTYDRVIIIEDDIILDFKNIHQKLNSLLKENPEFAFLGGHSEPSRRRIRGYVSKDQQYFNMTGPKDLYTATYAYSLTPETARNFVYKQIKSLTYIDDWKYLLAGSISTPFYYCFEHDDAQESHIANDRKNFMKKPNRFKKNFNKIKNDVISRFISLFVFKKIIRLADFLKIKK
ncbi:glycosyltransferase family 25 protein [Acinetobacter sp. ANC 4779]|uniref:glycosyltransferase family 25 protein n=1 Tax=Acinetobacter sp. ANC 4779 TaxID=2529848 RepID=UPI00103E5148|nr:glycosyltransferase family 25 protein [Acinetobacter sp. ANC 4779]TCB49813.1 glycosyltransferase family 25 protein [Acinetobacter sp. ANC 4779]